MATKETVRITQRKPRLPCRALQANLALLREAEHLLEKRQPSIACAGVYLLFDGAEVVYVGKSADLTRRLVEHRLDGLIPFDSFVAVKFAPEHLSYYETMAIRHHRPRYNLNQPWLPSEHYAKKVRARKCWTPGQDGVGKPQGPV